MTDLVTGATGHIGNVLVRQLLERGRQVRVLVRPGKSYPALQGLPVEFARGDILDPASLVPAVHGVEVVYHLAAHIGLAPGSETLTEHVNLSGTRFMLEAARQAGVRRLVYASSIYALRMPVTGVVNETCPFDVAAARGAYDRSKAAASLEVQAAAAAGLDAVLVCPTAVTGPHDYQVSEAGRGILYNMSPGIKFTVDGAYDFVDVRDVAAGMLLAAQRGQPGAVYILGGERLTVRAVSQIIWETAAGWHFGIHLPDWVADLAAEILPLLDDDPIISPYSLAAIRSNSNISHRKAEQELGYHPRPASRAVADAVRWWQEQGSVTIPVPEPISPAPA